MQATRNPVLAFLSGAALCALGVLALALRPAPPADWEYRVLINPTEKEIGQATDDGWEYVGFLGQSTKGPSMDQSLWRRPEQ